MRRSPLLLVLLTVAISVGAFLAVLGVGWSPLLGLDLQGGISVIYTPAHKVTDATLNEAISIIRDRVDALGVAEPNISRTGNDVSVQLPGVKNRAQALALIGQTAQLLFRPVLCAVPSYAPTTPTPKGKPAPALNTAPPACPSGGASGSRFANIPDTSRSYDTPGHTVLLSQVASSGSTQRYVLGPSLATGKILKNATAQIGTSGAWQVNFTLTSAGSPTFDSIAKRYYKSQVAVVLDGVVESAPTINSQSFGGQGQITGNFTETQAKNLALELTYGALPVQLNQQTVQSVSPTLGKSALKAGLLAGIIGLALVFLYTVVYYRALGIVVLLGLATTAALLWAIISFLGAKYGLALDLSGITGLIVSVGVVVDSYIVYFERLKDEVRAGRTIRSSVDRGFARAFRTIVAADLVSLIGAAVLYIFSIANVRGFAFYLGLSTALDVVTAYVFTRPLVILLGRSRLFTEARWLGVARGLGARSELVPSAGGAS